MTKTPLALSAVALFAAISSGPFADMKDPLNSPLPKAPQTVALKDGEKLLPKIIKRWDRSCTEAEPTLIANIVIYDSPIVTPSPQQLTHMNHLAVEEAIILICDADAPKEILAAEAAAELREQQIQSARRRILAAAGHRV